MKGLFGGGATGKLDQLREQGLALPLPQQKQGNVALGPAGLGGKELLGPAPALQCGLELFAFRCVHRGHKSAIFAFIARPKATDSRIPRFSQIILNWQEAGGSVIREYVSPPPDLFQSLTDIQIGKALRKWRTGLSLTGMLLAQKSGISQGYVSDIENGRRRLNEETAQKIAMSFGLETETLVAELVALAGDAESGPAEPWRQTGGGLSEESPPYRIQPQTPITMPPPHPVESLAKYLVDLLPRDKAFDLVHQFTDAARNGDPNAAARAQALLQLLTSP